MFDGQLRPLSVGLLLGMLLIAFQSLAVATVLPAVARDLDGLALYGWAFSAFFLGYLVSTVTLGGLADRDGPRRPFAIALVLLAAGLVVAGLAPSMGVLVAGRALQGLGAGAIGSIAYLAINRAYPESRRARMLALLSTAWVVPALVGPLVAGVVTERLSWHAVFLGLLPLVAVVAWLTLPALGRLRGEGAPLEAARVRRVARVAVGAVLVLSVLQQPAVWAALALAAGGLGLLVPALGRLLPPGGFRAAGPLAAGMMTRFLLTFSFLGADALVPLGLSELRGFTVTGAGLVLTCGAVTWAAGAALQARLDEAGGPAGRRARVRWGFGLVVASIVLMAVATLEPSLPAWLAGVAWAVGGFAMGLAFPAHTLVVFQHAPAGQEGRVSGTLQMVDVLGSALSAGAGGALVATLGAQTGLSAAYGLTAVAAALGLLAARGLSGSAPRAG